MLARCVWIDGGYVTLFGYDDVSHHTVCGLVLNGSLRMFDPQNGYVFHTREGEIATFEEVRERGPALRSAQFRAVKRLRGGEVDRYFRLFEPEHDWEIHIPSAPIWVKYMDYVYDLLGDPFLAWYQEIYFRRGKTDLFTRARLKHLGGRLDEALADYDRIIEGEKTAEPPVLQVDYRPVTWKVLLAETRFFRGQALFDMEAHRACLDGLGVYLREHPDNRWRDLALYYLGESCRKLGMVEDAVTCFAAIREEDLPGTPAPERLVRILDPIRARPGKTDAATGEE
jgi:tetratricopeptide (TPR) repeat protein